MGADGSGLAGPWRPWLHLKGVQVIIKRERTIVVHVYRVYRILKQVTRTCDVQVM